MMDPHVICKGVFSYWQRAAAGCAPGPSLCATEPRVILTVEHAMARRIQMNFLMSAVAALCALTSLTVAGGGSAAAAEETPWNETYAMPIAGRDRTIAVYKGVGYLVLTAGDAVDPALLIGQKDVVIATKFERDNTPGGRQRVRVPGLPGIIGEGDRQLFASRLDGDNLWLFGALSAQQSGSGRFDIVAVETAPSDAQIIAHQLAGLPATDYPARLQAANRIREQSLTQPNKEFWLAAADNVVLQVIDDAAAAAETARDTSLLLQAVTWAVEILKDNGKAGHVGSAAWTRQPGVAGGDEVAKRMRRLGLELYRDHWRPRAEALSQEFEDRFSAIGWRDADSFYRLGRWADLRGEYLPQAKDRSYRCYQAGYRANPDHQGIRNELGLPNSVRGDGTQAQVSGDFQHTASGTLVPAPQGWKRGDRIEGDITWIDPSSETAYLAAAVIETPLNPNLDDLWAGIVNSLRIRPEFSITEEDEPTFPQGLARRMKFTFREGRYVRQHEVILALNPVAHTAVRLDAGFAEDEAAQVHQILISTFDRLIIPGQAPGQR